MIIKKPIKILNISSLMNATFFLPITDTGEMNTSMLPVVGAVAVPSSYIFEMRPFAPNLGAHFKYLQYIIV